MPQFSVIMPCFNHAAFVGESIEGILAQTVRDLELIVIDDSSKDKSKEVIERYMLQDPRVRAIYHESNLGASRSRNDGIRASNGRYLAFCDADDVWQPVKLERQLKLLEQNPEHHVAYSDAEIIDERGTPTGRRFSAAFPVPGNGTGRLFEKLCTRNFINIQTVVLRRECIPAAGYFDERIKWVEDWWFWLKVSHSHKFIYSTELLAKYRVHSRSTSRLQREGYKINRIKVFHRILRSFPTISPKLKAEIFYHIGAAFKGLGRKTYARRCFMRSMEIQWANLRAARGLLLSFIESPIP